MSHCVDVDLDFGGSSELHNAKIVKARKKHKCGECYRQIKVGKKYEYVTQKFDGEFFCHKTCLDCLSVRDVFFSNGWSYGEIWEYLTEYFKDTAPKIFVEDTSELTEYARNRILKIVDGIIETRRNARVGLRKI